MSISEHFRNRNYSFQSYIFVSDIGITDLDVGCRISPILRSMSMPTYACHLEYVYICKVGGPHRKVNYAIKSRNDYLQASSTCQLCSRSHVSQKTETIREASSQHCLLPLCNSGVPALLLPLCNLGLPAVLLPPRNLGNTTPWGFLLLPRRTTFPLLLCLVTLMPRTVLLKPWYIMCCTFTLKRLSH